MRESHGIADAKRCGRISDPDDQAVRVTDGYGMVILSTTSTDPAGMSPDQAEYIAKALLASAARVRGSGAETPRQLTDQ